MLAMVIEVVGLLAVGLIAVIRRQYLWLFALCWTLVALAPYVAFVFRGRRFTAPPNS
jgi:hypothetical protein